MTETFGRIDGEAVTRVEIGGGALRASLLSYGAIVQDLRLEGHATPLVLGLNTLDDYIAHSPYFGAIAGRSANRIGHGRFMLDGATHQLDRNMGGVHHLHGGSRGVGKRNWRLAEQAPESVTLEIESADGDMGYPGHALMRCTYSILAPATLRVELVAEVDKPSLMNLTHHSYFCLDDGPDILGHRLQIAADRYVAVDQDAIPTGETPGVADTPFDFRAMRVIRSETAGARDIFDHNWCLADAPQADLAFAARLESPRSGLAMAVHTTEPGVQFYDGYKIDCPAPGLEGRRYGANAGLCLETQRWPDAPNHAGFPSSVLRPGETYRHVVDYRFEE